VKLECAVSNDVALVNISLYHNESGTWKLNQTNTVSGTTASTLFNVSVGAERTWVWNCYACDSVACEFAASNSTVTVDLTDPSISYASPTPSDGRTLASTDSAVINITSSDDNTNHSVILDWNNSLVGWWTFDTISGTTVKDNSTYGRDGVMRNGTYQSEGYFGKGMRFDGIDDYIEINSFTVEATPYTFEAWIKPHFSGTEDPNIVGKNRGSSGTGRKYGLGLKLAGSQLYGIAANNNNAWYTNLIYDIAAYEDVWTHVVFTITGTSGTQTGKLYVNGAEVDSYTGTAGYYSGYPFWIGAGKSSVLEGPFNGSIDEVRVYKRVLTAAEINASFDASRYRYENTFSGLGEGATYSYACDRSGG